MSNYKSLEVAIRSLKSQHVTRAIVYKRFVADMDLVDEQVVNVGTSISRLRKDIKQFLEDGHPIGYGIYIKDYGNGVYILNL